MSQESAPTGPVCYRHPGRESYIRCQRCERYVCPDCSRDAAVGVHCLDCLREGSRGLPQARTRFGGIARGRSDLVTLTLIGLNVAVFLLYQAVGPRVADNLALVGGWPGFGVAGGQAWRLITSAFLHTELWHIGINMLSLWILGRLLEPMLGRLRFVGLYLVAGLAGSAAAFALTDPWTWTLGASGAVFGLFGAVVMVLRRLRADLTWIAGVLAINVVLNVLYRDALSWQGHAGGFVAGLILGAALVYAPKERRDTWHIVGFVVMGVAIAAVVVGRTLMILP